MVEKTKREEETYLEEEAETQRRSKNAKKKQTHTFLLIMATMATGEVHLVVDLGMRSNPWSFIYVLS